MEHRWSGRSRPAAWLLLVSLFGPAASGHVRRTAAQLRAAGTPVVSEASQSPNSTGAAPDAAAAVAAFRRSVAASFTGLTLLRADGDDVDQGHEHEAAVTHEQEGDSADGAVPVHMQVPKEELEDFVSKLSKPCRVQFTEILRGQSSLHTFGDSGARSKDKCTALDGNLCTLHAHVSKKQAQSGRDLTSSTEVTGESCLPSKCMAESDLTVLADFMKSKARENIRGPNLDVDITLHVDCTASGGSTNFVGGAAHVAQQFPGKEAAKDFAGHLDPEHARLHSAASPGTTEQARRSAFMITMGIAWGAHGLYGM